jgi:hypothetical protein
LLILFDLAQSLVQVGEEARIIDGNGRLATEGYQEIALFRQKEIRHNPAIDVYCANTGIAHNQRSAHNRANTMHQHALSLFQLNLGIVTGHNRLTRTHNPLDGAAADFEVESAGINGARPFLASNLKTQLVGDRIKQDQKAALSLHHADYLIHDQTQHLVKFERRIEHTRNLVKRLQLTALAFEIDNAGIESITLPLEAADLIDRWRRLTRQRLRKAFQLFLKSEQRALSYLIHAAKFQVRGTTDTQRIAEQLYARIAAFACICSFDCHFQFPRVLMEHTRNTHQRFAEGAQVPACLPG